MPLKSSFMVTKLRKYLIPVTHYVGLQVFLLFSIFIMNCNFLKSQQFINGNLIPKGKDIFLNSTTYRKYGTEYRKLYSLLGCNPFIDENFFFKNCKLEGFDTLAHKSCTEFDIRLNRQTLAGPFCNDSSTSVVINLNGDTISDFGFSLKLNSPLLKDSVYDFTFLIKSESFQPWSQKFYDKNRNPNEDFKIRITQSNSPNSEGDEVAVITRQDVYEKDTDIYNYYALNPKTSSWYSQDDYYYTVKITIKGRNTGQFLTIKAKLEITDIGSTLFRNNLKPSSLYCTNWGTLNKGLYATRFKLQCPFNIQKSGSLCLTNNPLLLTSNSNYFTDKYLWSTGDTTTSITVKNPGLYWLQKDRNGCIWTDTLRIDSTKTTTNKLQVYIKCKDSTILIGKDSVNGQSKYQWTIGSKSAHVSVNTTGIFIRQSSINGCPAVDSFQVQDYSKHKAIATNNFTLCMNDSTNISALATNAEWYRQNALFSNLKEIQIKGIKSDTLILKSFDNCWQFDTIYINFIECDIMDYIFIPNAFTPDNDGINDVFKISGKSIQNLEMSIFNRWGELVFYSKNAEDGWDGFYKGSLVQNDIYLVQLKVKSVELLKRPSSKIYLQATVNLIR